MTENYSCVPLDLKSTDNIKDIMVFVKSKTNEDKHF